jgi:hypothetical protein
MIYIPQYHHIQFGHDSLRSLLEGYDGSSRHAISEASLNDTEKSQLALLFGGVGDGRSLATRITNSTLIDPKGDTRLQPSSTLHAEICPRAFT